MESGRNHLLLAAAVGVAAFVIWLLVFEGLVFQRTPPRLPFGISLGLNAAFVTLLVRRGRARA